MSRPIPLRQRPAPASAAAVSMAEESLGYLIRQAHRAFVKALAQSLEPHGILPGEWSALRVLWADEGLSQVELAERMRVEKASLTGVLNSLENKGLLRRVRNLEDRRKINLRLTAAGRGLEQRVLGCGAAVNNIAARHLSAAQIDELRALLHTVLDNLDAARRG